MPLPGGGLSIYASNDELARVAFCFEGTNSDKIIWLYLVQSPAHPGRMPRTSVGAAAHRLQGPSVDLEVGEAGPDVLLRHVARLFIDVSQDVAVAQEQRLNAIGDPILAVLAVGQADQIGRAHV